MHGKFPAFGNWPEGKAEQRVSCLAWSGTGRGEAVLRCSGTRQSSGVANATLKSGDFSYTARPKSAMSGAKRISLPNPESGRLAAKWKTGNSKRRNNRPRIGISDLERNPSGWNHQSHPVQHDPRRNGASHPRLCSTPKADYDSKKTRKTYARYADVGDISVTNNDDWDLSQDITITRRDGSSFHVYVSADREFARRFFDRLTEQWKKASPNGNQVPTTP